MPRLLTLLRTVVCLLGGIVGASPAAFAAGVAGVAGAADAAGAARAADDAGVEPQAPPFTAADVALDGPYVYAEPTGGWTAKRIVKVDGKLQPLVEKLPADKPALAVTVPGTTATFTVALRGPATAPESVLPAAEKLFVVSDIEGEWSALVKLLVAGKVIDENYAWTFGKGHVVYLGDLFDRGAHVVECLWLLYELEAKARAAGGAVHFVLGNHEVMNFVGDFRYVVPKYPATASLLGETLAGLHDRRTVLGQWLRTRNAMLKIGDELFVHGGVAPAVAAAKPAPAALNDALRKALAADVFGAPPIDPLLTLASGYPDGLIWYRGYLNEPIFPVAQIDAVLAAFAVKRIVIGHTIVKDIGLHHGGRVLAVDVHHARGISQAALRDADGWFRLLPTGERVALKP